jgi:hypothetical protein
MPQESTNTEGIVTTGVEALARQEADPSAQYWEADQKPRRMTGYSLSNGQRRTRVMLPKRASKTKSYQLKLPRWHKPYADALLEVDPEILTKLLTATEMALFERLLELTANQDERDERHDIARAIDVIVSLKAKASQANLRSPV